MRGLSILLPLLLLATHCHGSPSEETVVSAIREAKRINSIKREFNKLLKRTGGDKARAGGGCPAMLSAYHNTKRMYNEKEAHDTEDMLMATKLLTKRGHTLEELNKRDVVQVWQREFECTPMLSTSDCDAIHAADPEYRTPDGSCNNKDNPTWGMAGAVQKRNLAVLDYDDAIGSPRQTSSDGQKALPSARKISRQIHSQRGRVNSATMSLHMMGIAQFLDHDLGLTSEAEEIDDCCDETEADNDNCFNIAIKGDKDGIQNGRDCMPFIRSKAKFPDCTPTARRQANDITSFIDCSNIYGSSLSEQKKLRQGETGAMLDFKTMTVDQLGTYIRLPDDPDQDACTHSADQTCSIAGDTRLRLHAVPSLTSYHELGLLEHNRIVKFYAKYLLYFNFTGDTRLHAVPSLTSYHELGLLEHNRIVTFLRPYYTDDEDGNEALFQRARSIVIAEYQHMYYSEFLPKLFGTDLMETLGLSTEYVYDPDVDASMANEFLIAYRLHTLVSDRMIIFNKGLRPLQPEYRAESDLATDDTFSNPAMTYYYKEIPDPRGRTETVQGFNGLQYWLSGDPSPELDRFLVKAVQERLFKTVDENGDFLTGLDLAALNIQRGRDHGLPSYNQFRKFCDLEDITAVSWETTAGLDPNIRDTLLEVYNDNLEDIDLWTGAYTELPTNGAAVGPLLQCILGKQFLDLRSGDRFWYENADAGFTEAQLTEIKKASLSRLLCDNMNYASIMPNSFDIIDRLALVDCSNIVAVPWVDLCVFAPDGGSCESNPPQPPQPPQQLLEPPNKKGPPPKLPRVRNMEETLQDLERIALERWLEKLGQDNK